MIDKAHLRDILVGPFARQRLFGKSAETRRQYVLALDKFDAFLGRPATLEDLDDDVVAMLLMEILGDDHSPRSVNNVRAYIVSLWRWCNAKGYAALGPTIQKLPEPESIPVAFTKEQLAALFAVAREQGKARRRDSREIFGVPGGLWWEGLYRSIFSTGERIGAVRRWSRGMLDQGTGVLMAPGSIRKGGRFSHTAKLSPRALEIVRDVLARHQRPAVFPWNRSEAALYKIMGQHLVAAGLPTDPYLWKFHAIRKSHASYVALEAGEAAAQESLGHVSRANTKRYIAPAIVVPKTWEHVLPDI